MGWIARSRIDGDRWDGEPAAGEPLPFPVGVVGGGVVMVPPWIGLDRQADGRIRADLSLAAADTRSGKVLWRSISIGSGAIPREALDAALVAVLPLDTGGP